MADKFSRLSLAGLDDVDLRFAARELADAHKMLMDAYALADRCERAEAIKAAIAKLGLASRQIDEVVDRRTP